MSTAAQTNELSLTMIIDLTKENALALYGRSMTYSIITTCPQSRGSTLATQKYDGHKIHALLIGYSIADPGRGKLLRGAYTQGSGRTPPTVACALRLLFDETRRDVLGFVDQLVATRNFEGGLMRGAEFVQDADGNVDDGIDGVTLRGD